MKKAKVSKGVVERVWPWEKTLPDGSVVVKEFKDSWTPKGLSLPDWLVDVPDDVKINWVWDGEKYTPRIKDNPDMVWVYHHKGNKWVYKPKPLPPKDFFKELIAEKLGTTLDELKAEANQRKADYLKSK